MTRIALKMIAVGAAAALCLTGCANSQKDSDMKIETATGVAKPTKTSSTAAFEFQQVKDAGDFVSKMKAAPAPAFPVGAEVVVKADRMEGMKDSIAKVVGAYETTAYEVSYTPTTGGPEVKGHKWVVFEELMPHADAPTAELNADHLPGMKGADAKIDSETKGTVYMVDIISGPHQKKDYKWFVESELAPK